MEKKQGRGSFQQRHRPNGPAYRQHQHRMHHAAQGGAAGGVAGAAVAGVVPVAERYLGKEATTKLTDETMKGLPKDMLAGLGIGVMVGGLGAYLLHRDQDRERDASGDRGEGGYGDGFTDGFREGRKEAPRGSHGEERSHHAARIAESRDGHHSGQERR